VKSPDRTHYGELDVREDATPSRIRAAFRRLALRHHPDRNPNDDAAEETFKRVSAAYGVLDDITKREEYDRWLRAAREAATIDRDASHAERTTQEPGSERGPCSESQGAPPAAYASKDRTAAAIAHARHRPPTLEKLVTVLFLSFFPVAVLTVYVWISLVTGLGLSVWAAYRWRKAQRARLIARIEAAAEREQGVALGTPDNPWVSAAIIGYALLFLFRAALDFPALVAHNEQAYQPRLVQVAPPTRVGESRPKLEIVTPVDRQDAGETLKREDIAKLEQVTTGSETVEQQAQKGAAAYKELCGQKPSFGYEHGAIVGLRELIQRHAHDPGSIEVVGCTTPIITADTCWIFQCNVRGKNALGARVLQTRTYQGTRFGFHDETVQSVPINPALEIESPALPGEPSLQHAYRGGPDPDL
jgi:DnaJ domain